MFLTQEILTTGTKDALYEQIDAFSQSIMHGQEVMVDGEAGMNCLELALKIQGLVYQPQPENTLV